MANVWLITGASRGLGLEIARSALAAGHTVVATSRSLEDVKSAFEAERGDVHTYALDITDNDAAISVTKAVTDRFGRIDVLVNNAGQALLGWFETISTEHVRRQFDINVFGTMNVTRAVVPHMRARRSGLLVTISSVNGLLSHPGGSVYASSKFAIEGWIEGFAQELAPLGVRSLIVEPGMLRTDFLDNRSANHGDINIADYTDAVRQFRSFIAEANHNQPGDPAMLASTIVALASAGDPPARFVFGEDARTWVEEKLEKLKAELEYSSAPTSVLSH